MSIQLQNVPRFADYVARNPKDIDKVTDDFLLGLLVISDFLHFL